MHKKEMNPPGQSIIDALNTTTPLLDLNPLSINHR